MIDLMDYCSEMFCRLDRARWVTALSDVKQGNSIDNDGESDH